MPSAKTVTERVQASRRRRAALGLVRLELYLHHDDHPAVKAYAAELTARRTKGGKTPPASG